MDIYKILSHKNLALSQKAIHSIVFPLAEEIKEEIDKLKDTLRYQKGVYEKRGLAISSTQVGLTQRFFLIGIGNKIASKKIAAIINPEILDFSQEKSDDLEGCLSIPKYMCLVERSNKIVVKFQNLAGREIKTEFEGIEARIFQHEFDHLNGIHMLKRAKKIEINPLYTEFKDAKAAHKIIVNSDGEEEEEHLENSFI